MGVAVWLAGFRAADALSPTSLPPFPCGVTGVPLFPEAASSPHSHLIRSARSMGLWYGSVTSMRRVGRP